MLFGNGMKDLALTNNIKLLLDNDCLKRELLSTLGKHGNECTCINEVKEILTSIQTDLDLLEECEKTSKDVLSIGTDSRVLNINLPHQISAFAIKDMNAYLACRNDIQQSKAGRMFTSLIGSKRKQPPTEPSSSGWLTSSIQPPLKKKKFMVNTPKKETSEKRMYQAYEVEGITDDETEVIKETPTKVQEQVSLNKECQVGFPLNEYKQYYTKTIDEEEQIGLWSPSTKICQEKQKEILKDKGIALEKLRKITTYNNLNKYRYICWNWNEKECHNEECNNGSMCLLRHICMAELPTGAMCRSRDHTFIEHKMFYKYGKKEGEFMRDHFIITQDQYGIINDIAFQRKQELRLIYDRDLQIGLARRSFGAREFVDCVSREVLCSDMIGLEGKRIPFQIADDDDDDWGLLVI